MENSRVDDEKFSLAGWSQKQQVQRSHQAWDAHEGGNGRNHNDRCGAGQREYTSALDGSQDEAHDCQQQDDPRELQRGVHKGVAAASRPRCASRT